MFYICLKIVDIFRVTRCNVINTGLESDVLRIRLIFIISLLSTLAGCILSDKLVTDETAYRKLDMFDRTVFIYQDARLFDLPTVKTRLQFEKDLFPAVLFARDNPILSISVKSYGGDATFSSRSLRRNLFKAEVVAAYFWQQGISSDRIRWEGFAGGVDTISPEDSPLGSLENNRIEISFIPGFS